MTILDQIIAHKQKEVEERKSLYPVKLLEQSIYFPGQPVSMKKYIQRGDKTGIIAEFKRKSPSGESSMRTPLSSAHPSGICRPVLQRCQY